MDRALGANSKNKTPVRPHYDIGGQNRIMATDLIISKDARFHVI